MSEASQAVQSPLFSRMQKEITAYMSDSVEISPGVKFSQYKLVSRNFKFRNRTLNQSKINADLSYDYYFDIIAPRADSEMKNLRFDSKHIKVFSQSPRVDFAAVFLTQASLKLWMAENGEDEKLKEAVEEFVTMGNVVFKKIKDSYELMDTKNTIITNQIAKNVDETDIIERHEMIASELKGMTAWDQEKVDDVIKDMGNKSFKSQKETTDIQTSQKKYEIYEFTGEVSDLEFQQLKGKQEGKEHEYYLAKVVVAGLNEGGIGEKKVLFAEPLPKNKKMSDYYKEAHRGPYTGRWWRAGMYEILFDHQIRANEIGNNLARGLEWASKVVFQSTDSSILQNIRADIENGDVIVAKDLKQVDVRMQAMDQLIADWNRLMRDADTLSNSLEIVRGESLPSGTPFRLGVLQDQNAGKLYTFLRQKISLPYKRVFKEWILPNLIKDMKGKDIVQLTGDTQMLEEFRAIAVQSWYQENLVKIGPHTEEMAKQIKDSALADLKKTDPVIKNTSKIWEKVMPRLLITITGENSDIQDQMQDMMAFIELEQDIPRRNWLLDQMYAARNIPVPPKADVVPPQGSPLPGAPMTGGPEEVTPQDTAQPLPQ